MHLEPALASKLAAVSTRPGVYLLKDARGKVLYVGKAKSLRSRVRSYFTPASTDDRRLLPYLRRRLHDFDTVLVDNEKEALLLEDTLIKQHKPRYNVRLVDDKTYLSLKLDRRHPFPRFLTIRRPREDGARYFGPYSSARAVRSTLKLIYRMFGIRSCTDAVFANRLRPCLYHQIGQCSAPCVGLISQDDYAATLRQSELFLDGRSQELVADLRAEMLALADAERFEEAARLRDRLRAVERTTEKQDVAPGRDQDFDVVGHADLEAPAGAAGAAVGAFVWLVVRDGRIVDTATVRVQDPAGTPVAGRLATVLLRVYETRPIPAAVLVPCEPQDHPALEQILSERRGARVAVSTPRRGSRRRLLGIAQSNAVAALELQARRGERDLDLLRALGEVLRLPRAPTRIECFDISNLGGTLAVGSMVVAIDGVPAPSEYRRYRMKTAAGGDDYACMRELLTRRLRRAVADDTVPDLLLVDGGPGQLSVALEVARAAGLDELPVAAIAKGPDRNAGRELIHAPGRRQPLRLAPDDDRLHLLQRIRDEAHRFAITYQRDLRRSRDRTTELTQVPGLGPKRIKALLKSFGSIDGIRRAPEAELRTVAGMNGAVAAALYAHLHGPGDAAAAAERRATEAVQGNDG